MSAYLFRPWVGLFLLLAVMAACQIWLSHLRYEMSLHSQKLQAEKQEVLKQSGLLRLELASLTRPERLRQIAVDKLGMAPPSPMQMVQP